MKIERREGIVAKEGEVKTKGVGRSKNFESCNASCTCLERREKRRGKPESLRETKK